MIIIKIKFNTRAPEITLTLKKELELLDKPNDFLLCLQLNYREENTLIYLNKINCINFEEYWLTVTLKNNSTMFFNYNHVLEYSIVNATELKQKEVVYA